MNVFSVHFKVQWGGKRECKEPRVEAIYSTAPSSTPTRSIVYMVYLAHRFERHLHCVKMNNNNKWWHRLQAVSAKRNGNSNDTARHDKENVKDKTNLKRQEIDSSNI